MANKEASIGKLTAKERAYLRKLARPDKRITVTVDKSHDWKNQGVPQTVTLRAGYCPCTICKHESKVMVHCEEANCQCCSGTCT